MAKIMTVVAFVVFVNIAAAEDIEKQAEALDQITRAGCNMFLDIFGKEAYIGQNGSTNIVRRYSEIKDYNLDESDLRNYFEMYCTTNRGFISEHEFMRFICSSPKRFALSDAEAVKILGGGNSVENIRKIISDEIKLLKGYHRIPDLIMRMVSFYDYNKQRLSAQDLEVVYRLLLVAKDIDSSSGWQKRQVSGQPNKGKNGSSAPSTNSVKQTKE